MATMTCKLVYVETEHEPEAAEMDCADYPHTFCAQDGVPYVAVADVFDEATLAKIKNFFETEVTYEHG